MTVIAKETHCFTCRRLSATVTVGGFDGGFVGASITLGFKKERGSIRKGCEKGVNSNLCAAWWMFISLPLSLFLSITDAVYTLVSVGSNCVWTDDIAIFMHNDTSNKLNRKRVICGNVKCFFMLVLYEYGLINEHCSRLLHCEMQKLAKLTILWKKAIFSDEWTFNFWHYYR